MMTRPRILPLVMVFAAVGFTFKAGNLVTDVSDLIQRAEAQESSEPDNAADAPDAAATDQGAAAALVQSLAVTDPLLMSRSELDLLQDLSNRRQELDNREQQMDMREKLLRATEQRIDGKIARLATLESRIDELVRAHEDQENKQLKSIVKVYENMKPKDAARILERLDMKIQLEVATRMKEVKMAPIMAAMSPERAQKLTAELAVRAQLPPLDG